MHSRRRPNRRPLIALACWLGLWSMPAAAQIAVDRLIVELPPRAGANVDIEVRNQRPETAYVLVEAAEIVNPGAPDEERRSPTDPEALGLLAAPTRLVLEGGARRIVRLARLDEPGATERVWRVSVRPVTGPTESDVNAVQVLVGYGVLVFGRPENAHAEIDGARSGGALTLTNSGNANALLFDGRQCAPTGSPCVEFPTRRLYAGNRWAVELRWATPVTFRIEGPTGLVERDF